MVSSTDTGHGTEATFTMPRLFQFDLDEDPLQQSGSVDAATPTHVLDVASGAGEWVLAVAQRYPQTHIVGIERDAELINQARAQAHSKGVSNVSFLHMDPLQKLDLPDNSFDVVNLRFVATIVPSTLWPHVLKECLRVTRSGGIIRLTETDLPISTSIAFEQFNGFIARLLYTTHQSFSPDGVSFAITPMLSDLLSQAGCLDIQQTTAISNFSTGTAAHAPVIQDITQTYQQMQPFLSQAHVAMQEEISHTYQEMVSEMQAENFCAVAFYMTVRGKKP